MPIDDSPYYPLPSYIYFSSKTYVIAFTTPCDFQKIIIFIFDAPEIYI